jgi:competence protein ComGC
MKEVNLEINTQTASQKRSKAWIWVIVSVIILLILLIITILVLSIIGVQEDRENNIIDQENDIQNKTSEDQINNYTNSNLDLAPKEFADRFLDSALNEDYETYKEICGYPQYGVCGEESYNKLKETLTNYPIEFVGISEDENGIITVKYEGENKLKVEVNLEVDGDSYKVYGRLISGPAQPLEN